MQTIETATRLLRAEDAAAILGVRLRRTYELARRGVIPSVRLGRQIRFSTAALDEFIRAGGQKMHQTDEAGAASPDQGRAA